MVSNIPPGEMGKIPKRVKREYFDNTFKRYGVHDDGSCFFHTICAAMNIDGYLDSGIKERENIGRKFRKKIRNEISKKNWNKVWTKRGVLRAGGLPSLKKMKTMLGDHRTWADVYIILYVMDKMNKNMLFFDMSTSSESLYCGVRGLNTHAQDTILVAWVNHSHFEPICREVGGAAEEGGGEGGGGRDRKGVRHGHQFFYPSDDRFVMDLMDTYYNSTCKGEMDDIRNVI